MIDVDGERARDRERLRVALESAAPHLAERIAERISNLEATPSLNGLPLVNDIAHQVTQMLAATTGSDSAPTTEDGRRHLEQFSARVLRAGVPVDNVLRGIRIALEEGMSLTETLSDDLELAPAARSPFIRRLLAWSDLAMLTASESHHELIASIPERLRRFAPLLTRMRSGQPTPDDLDALSRAGQDSHYSALIARLPLADSMSTVRLIDELVGRGAVAAWVDDEVIALIAELPKRSSEATGGIGPRVTDLTESFRLADRALHTLQTLGWKGVHSFDDLGILPAVVADQDVGRALIRRYVDPCLGAPGGADLITTVSSYLAENASVTVTAATLAVHENTVRYRLARFEELTNSSLRDTRSRAEIWWAITPK